MPSILLSPLQLVLWGPLQPVRVSQSQGVSFPSDEVGSGAFNNDFNYAFSLYGNYPFSSAFASDFAVASEFKIQSFNLDFSGDFDKTQINVPASFSGDYSNDFQQVGIIHRGAFNNDFSSAYAQGL